MYQTDDQEILSVNHLNIGKLSHCGGINLDTCNADRKIWRLIVDSV